MGTRGATLLTTLIWLAVIATLGFVLASLSVQHLNSAAVRENRAQALDLARSAVSVGIGRIVGDTSFGRDVAARPPQERDLVTVRHQGTRPGAVGYLTFHPRLAERQGIACSTNNLEGDNAVAGSGGRTVPKNSVLLIGEGRCGGVVRRVEAVLAVPPFPYALASAGPVVARRGVTVAGVRTQVTAPLTGDEQLVPANLLSNDAGASAVVLGPGTVITGDVSAAGTVQLDSQALAQGSIRIQGRVNSGAAREKIPRLRLASYDPAVGQAPFTPLNSEQLSGAGTVLSGAFRRQGSLTVGQGLRLDGGVLYVHGDLTVRGGISGRGLVVATGDVRVEGQNDFRSGNGVALLAGQDLTLSGSGVQGSYFQGLVYTEGSFTADRVTLLGTMIAAGEENPRPVTLENARVVQELGPPLRVSSGAGNSQPVNLPGYVNAPVLPSEQCQAWFTLVDGQWQVRVVITAGTNGSTGFSRVLGSTYQEVRSNLIDGFAGLGRPSPSGLTMIEQWVDDVMGGPPPPPPDGDEEQGPPAASVLTLDPSEFLHLAERIRVVRWSES